MSDPRGKYRIQTVAELTGVPAATLRAWERRYGIPVPQRTPSSYRVYSDEDIAMIRRLRSMCDEGMSPSEAARLVLSDIDASQPVHAGTEEDPLAPVRDGIIAAVDRFDARRLERELERASVLGPATTIIDQVLRPVMIDVGERWHDGRMSVAQEHLATESITTAARRLLTLVQPEGESRTVLLACFADDEHAFPLQALAVHMATWGWRSVLLGARTPPSAIGHAVEELRPDLVGLSVTVTPPLHRARELVEGYADACGAVPWIVGGSGAADLAKFVVARGGHVIEEIGPRNVRGTIDRIAAANHRR